MAKKLAELFTSIEDVQAQLKARGYLADRNLAAVVYVASRLEKPLLVEGPAGVGKTELAKALAGIMGAELIRLQCYEGLDESKALYQWNYQMQLLRIQTEGPERRWQEVKSDIYTPEFLLARPLLKALEAKEPVTLLIDELDKSDEEFESFLLEILSDFQISIPEMGTVTAVSRPLVVITSNSLRQFSDALRRRCVFLYIDYPDRERELEIIRLKLPGIGEDLARQAAAAVQKIRSWGLKKPPSIAETLDWAGTLLILGAEELDNDLLVQSLPALIKHKEDTDLVLKRVSGKAIWS